HLCARTLGFGGRRQVVPYVAPPLGVVEGLSAEWAVRVGGSVLGDEQRQASPRAQRQQQITQAVGVNLPAHLGYRVRRLQALDRGPGGAGRVPDDRAR